MDLTQLLTAVIGAVFGSGGTFMAYLGTKKAKAQKAADNELEANKLVADEKKRLDAEDDKVWVRQEEQLAKMETKLASLEQRISTLESENVELKRDMALQAVWGVRFIMNANAAGQQVLIPLPLPAGVSAYFPPAASN